MLIDIKDIYKIYTMGDNVIKAVNGVSLKIEHGEFVTIMGQSGSGKSTLMHILGCLDTPDSGFYELDGVNIDELDDNQLSSIRNEKIGFVFQSFNLLSHRDILHNVSLPLSYRGIPKELREEKAKNTLKALGLGERLDHKPTELSGGQNQRVAISRALSGNAPVILADEPTGNLDSNTSNEIMALFQQLNELGKTVIMVTHDPEVAHYSKRVIEIKDGSIIGDKKNKNVRKVDIKLPYDLSLIMGEKI